MFCLVQVRQKIQGHYHWFLTVVKENILIATSRIVSHSSWIFQGQRKQKSNDPLYLLTPSLSICASSSAYPLFLHLLLPALSYTLSFWPKTFPLIRASVEWNHRGVCSVLTLFVFLLPPYALLHSGNEVEWHARHDCVYMCVACTRVFVGITSLNYSDVVERTWQGPTESQDVNQEKALYCIQSAQLHYHIQ